MYQRFVSITLSTHKSGTYQVDLGNGKFGVAFAKYVTIEIPLDIYKRVKDIPIATPTERLKLFRDNLIDGYPYETGMYFFHRNVKIVVHNKIINYHDTISEE